MSQATNFGVPLVGPASPAEVAGRMNSSLDALLSGHSGPSRPSYAAAGTLWVSTAIAGKLGVYMYDGADDNLLATLDTTTGFVGYRLKNIRRITASTTYTPDAEIRAVLVRAQGAGGSGGAGGTNNVANASAGTGGGSGGFVEKLITSPVAATITIGAAGAAVTSTGGTGVPGNNGGNTTYNDGTNNLVAGGGPGGNGGFTGGAGFQVFTGVAGGTATGGDINIPGEGSENSVSAGTGVSAGQAYAQGTNGGNSLFGHGGSGGGVRQTSDTRVDGTAGTGFGSGGGAGVRILSASGVSTSGAGRPGYVEIWEFV